MTSTETEKRRDYIKERGLHCPHCGSKNMSYEEPRFDPAQAIIEILVKCNSPACKKTWEELYSLTNVFLSEKDS